MPSNFSGAFYRHCGLMLTASGHNLGKNQALIWGKYAVLCHRRYRVHW